MSNEKWLIAAGAGLVLLGGYGVKKMIDLTKEGQANRQKWLALVTKTEQAQGMPSGLLDRLLAQESRYRTDIINGTKRSSAGALGIAQFMPATAAQEMGSIAAALDPAKAIPAAGKYLAKLKNQTGNWKTAVAAYNWGVGNVLKKGIAVAPLETKNYVQAVYGESIA